MLGRQADASDDLRGVPGSRCAAAELARSRAGPRAGADPGRRPAGCAAPTCTCSTARSTSPDPPRVLGHQIVGACSAGDGAEGLRDGGLVGVPWLGWTCGECEYCRSGRENLCPRARFTGCDIDGGYGRVHRRRRALLLPLARGLRRAAGGPPALRRADRLPRPAPLPATRGGWASTALARPPTSSRRSPHAGPRGVRLHPRPGRRRAALRARAGRRLGRRLR